MERIRINVVPYVRNYTTQYVLIYYPWSFFQHDKDERWQEVHCCTFGMVTNIAKQERSIWIFAVDTSSEVLEMKKFDGMLKIIGIFRSSLLWVLGYLQQFTRGKKTNNISISELSISSFIGKNELYLSQNSMLGAFSDEFFMCQSAKLYWLTDWTTTPTRSRKKNRENNLQSTMLYYESLYIMALRSLSL